MNVVYVTFKFYFMHFENRFEFSRKLCYIKIIMPTDENNNLAEECEKLGLSCAHGCKPKGNTYECFCQAGYRLQNDLHSCSGIHSVSNVCALITMESRQTNL